MTSFLEEISEVCIYLQKGDSTSEKINEIALYQPLAKKSVFDDTHQILKGRKSSFTRQLPFSKRLILKVQTFFLAKMPGLIKEERKSIESKFKTVLAILFSQDILLDFFLGEITQRDNFFKTLTQAANHWKYHQFTLPSLHLTASQMAHFLTTLSWQTQSLLENIEELNLQMAAIGRKDRDEILFSILNNIQRMPITSVIEIASGNRQIRKISITTQYGKYKIKNIDPKTGMIDCEAKENETKASIPIDEENYWAGTVNQHTVYDTTSDPIFIGAVSGYLKTSKHVLEQILFLLKLKGEISLVDSIEYTEEKIFLFSSLFSWNEYDKIQNEHNAIEAINGKTLMVGERKIRMVLIHQNIPFNAFNKFPVPSEINASLNDLNDTGLMVLSQKTLKFLNIDFPSLTNLLNQNRETSDFLKKQQNILDNIDTFRSLQNILINELDNFLVRTTNDLSKRILAFSLKALLLKKLPNGKSWHEIDHLIYLSLLAKHLQIMHSKNCEYATDRSAGAISIDKAQNAFQSILGKPYLPGLSTSQENALFKVFYSMYLVFEEPELNAGLCTGFVGEKFYDNFIQKNPETTYYLLPWLQKHPETYLGLSRHRY